MMFVPGRTLVPVLKAPVAALGLVVLLAGSWIENGLVAPQAPQAVADRAYRELWSGNLNGPQGAVSRFRQALIMDPAFPYRWADLGEALADAGDMRRAQYCFRRAIELAPNSPQIAMRAANFSFREGDTGSGLRLTSRVLGMTPDYDAMVFSSWIRLGGGLGTVLESGVGNNARAGEAFFRFLLAAPPSDSVDETRARTWAWLVSRSYVNPALARTWVVWLIGQHRGQEAVPVWKRYLTRDAAWAVTNWIDNGGFEAVPSGDGFDWRITQCPGVRTEIDAAVAHSGGSSLRIDFDGTQNPEFSHVAQHLAAPAGRYRLTAWIRTENLSTDQGVALFSNGVSTDALNGTHDWTEVSAEVTVRAGVSPGDVQVVRRRSWRFDGKPQGKAWIDDVELRRID